MTGKEVPSIRFGGTLLLSTVDRPSRDFLYHQIQYQDPESRYQRTVPLALKWIELSLDTLIRLLLCRSLPMSACKLSGLNLMHKIHIPVLLPQRGLILHH